MERGVQVTLGAPLASTGLMRRKLAEPALIQAARGHRAVLGASGARFTRGVFESLPELRFIAKLGIGTELIDLDAATEHGVMVTNTPVHSEVVLVAEHTVALILGLQKRLHLYAGGWLRAGRWKDPAAMSAAIRGATVGIIGFGQIGRSVAERLRPWGATLLATDVREPEPLEGVTFVDFDTLLRRSDVVTLHTPGRPMGSPALIDERALDLMKPSAVLINTARGNLVDTSALVARLAGGGLAGAGLDVFNPEPPEPEAPLLQLPNVLLTPHVAAWNPGLRKEMAQMAFENLWSMFEGRVPPHLVNREVVEGAR